MEVWRRSLPFGRRHTYAHLRDGADVLGLQACCRYSRIYFREELQLRVLVEWDQWISDASTTHCVPHRPAMIGFTV